MDPWASRRAPSVAARVGYAAVRTLLILGLCLGTVWLSIVASVWGLSAVLVVVALVGLVVARTVHRASTPDAPSAARARRAFVIAAVFIVGFFVLLTFASQIWASH